MTKDTRHHYIEMAFKQLDNLTQNVKEVEKTLRLLTATMARHDEIDKQTTDKLRDRK